MIDLSPLNLIIVLIGAITIIVYFVASNSKPLKQYLFSRIWTPANVNAIDQEFRRHKIQLFSEAIIKGRVIEIGSGTGVNLKYLDDYSDDISEVICVEPNKRFQNEHLKASSKVSFQVKFFQGTIEDYIKDNNPENKFDVIICFLVLCSVPNPDTLIQQLHYILKDAGKFVILEHIKEREKKLVKLSQYLFYPFWKIKLDDCSLIRETDKKIRRFQWKEIKEDYFRRNQGYQFVSQMYKCLATK